MTEFTIDYQGVRIILSPKNGIRPDAGLLFSEESEPGVSALYRGDYLQRVTVTGYAPEQAIALAQRFPIDVSRNRRTGRQ